MGALEQTAPLVTSRKGKKMHQVLFHNSEKKTHILLKQQKTLI